MTDTDQDKSYYVAACTTSVADYYEVQHSIPDLLAEIEGFDAVKFVHEYNPVEGWSRDVSEDIARLWLEKLTKLYGQPVSKSQLPTFIIRELPDHELDAYHAGESYTVNRAKPETTGKSVQETALALMHQYNDIYPNAIAAYYVASHSKAGAEVHLDAVKRDIAKANAVALKLGVRLLPVTPVTPTKEDSDNDN